jgi:hypothetical protein
MCYLIVYIFASKNSKLASPKPMQDLEAVHLTMLAHNMPFWSPIVRSTTIQTLLRYGHFPLKINDKIRPVYFNQILGLAKFRSCISLQTTWKNIVKGSLFLQKTNSFSFDFSHVSHSHWLKPPISHVETTSIMALVKMK